MTDESWKLHEVEKGTPLFKVGVLFIICAIIAWLVITDFWGNPFSPPDPTPTPDDRPRISGCIPADLITFDDIFNNPPCVVGIVTGMQEANSREDRLEGKPYKEVLYLSRPTPKKNPNGEIIGHYYNVVVIVYLDGPKRFEGDGVTDYLEQKYPLLINAVEKEICIGIKEDVHFADFGLIPTFIGYYITVHSSEDIFEIENCESLRR